MAGEWWYRDVLKIRWLRIHKTDVAKTYVDWAVKHDFAVIDVNIPKHITDPEVGWL